MHSGYVYGFLYYAVAFPQYYIGLYEAGCKDWAAALPAGTKRSQPPEEKYLAIDGDNDIKTATANVLEKLGVSFLV